MRNRTRVKNGTRLAKAGKTLYIFGIAIALALFAGIALFVTPSGQAQEGVRGKRRKELFKGKEVVAGEVLVKFRESATRRGIDEAKSRADAGQDKMVGGAGLRLFRSRSKDTATLVEELRSRPDVLYAEPNYVIRVAAVPANLSATSQRQGEARLAWSDRSSNEQSFSIERSTSSGSGFAEITRVGANAVSYTDRTGRSKTTYYYRVRALNSGGSSGYTNTVGVRIK